MISYIVRRLAAIVPLLLIVSFIIFVLTQFIPGDPARNILGTKAPNQTVAELQHKLGVDRPWIEQYFKWLGNAVRGNLGHSWYHQTESVTSQIRIRLPITANMAVGALVITVLLGLPLGLIAGTRPQSIADRIVTLGTSAAIAAPDFWLAMMLLIFFAVKLKL